MNKTLKLSLRISAAIFGLLIIAAVLFFINFRQGIKDMTPAKTGALNDSVYIIKDRFVNAYLFKGNDAYLAVDAGMGAKYFKKEMAKIGIKPEQVKTLLLTHTDSDHTGATGLFTNANIYMHKNEEQMIDGTTGKTKYSKTVWKYGSYVLLSDNDILTIDGLKIKILHTPGHTPGSSCYIIGSEYLVTGDNLTISDGNYMEFIEKFNMNTPEQLESLKTLPDPSSFKYILTGHHGVFKF
jgi:glyoxylase-like metal-dependent hydrolase (beta-lactamase superfamily II)